jgi:tetratricopeptide (TPR) repeat protein
MSRPWLFCAVLLLIAPTALAQSKREEGLAFNEQGVKAFGEGDPIEALRLFLKARELIPEDATVRRNTARCMIELGDRELKAGRHERAARYYHDAGGGVPGDPVARLREARALYRALRDRDALAILKALVRDVPKNAKARELIGLVLYRLGKNALAIEHWEQALALDPKNEALAERIARTRREESVEKELYVDLSAAHFAIKYDGSSDRRVGQQVAAVLEEAYQRVGGLLGRYPQAEVSVVVYPAKTFRATTGAHKWVAGLFDGKIRVPAGGLAEAPADEVRRVLTHEYAHALVRAVGGPKVPVWLHEGFAQVATGRSRAAARRHCVRATAPALRSLVGSFARQADAGAVRVLYAAACDFVHSLLAQGGAPGLAELLESLARKEPLDQALRRIYAQDLAELYAGWLATLP